MLRINYTQAATGNFSLITKFARIFSGKKVLDIGCGGERTMIFKHVGCNIIGINIIDNRDVKHAAEYDFINADAQNLPFQDESFDAVVSFDVIEHVRRDELFLSEAKRVCKKNGLIMLETPNRNRLSNKIRQTLGMKIKYPLQLGKGCTHLREYVMEDVIKIVKKSGLEIKERHYIWLGLPGIGGFAHFPNFLNKWAQNLIIIAQKPKTTYRKLD